METMRLILVFLHTFIIIFATINLSPRLNAIGNASNSGKRISAIITYAFDLFYLSLYHTVSILAVWFSRRYGAGLIRASGILLIGELLHTMTLVTEKILESNHMGLGEFSVTAIYELLVLIALLITFRLAEKVSICQKNLLQVELLADTAHTVSLDSNVEPL